MDPQTELLLAHHDRGSVGAEMPATAVLTPDDRWVLHGLLSRMAGRQQDGHDQPS